MTKILKRVFQIVREILTHDMKQLQQIFVSRSMVLAMPGMARELRGMAQGDPAKGKIICHITLVLYGPESTNIDLLHQLLSTFSAHHLAVFQVCSNWHIVRAPA